jgi:Domain of unknown function (DUF222)/HNH endonuclease
MADTTSPFPLTVEHLFDYTELDASRAGGLALLLRAGIAPAGGGVMSTDLLAASKSLRAALAAADPDLLSGSDCTILVTELAATEKACAGLRARAAARAAACGAHREAGYSDATEWLARTTGASRGAARAELDTAAALEDCPATAAALAEGRLSLTQAGEIARAEAAAPGSEAELVELAATSSLAGLKEKARARRLASVPVEELHSRQLAARHFTHWQTELGNVGFSGELPPEVGVAFVNRIEAEAARRKRAVRREGPHEPFPAHAADALAALVAGEGVGGRGVTDVVVVCDVIAFLRGYALPGEICHVLGAGPIPVSVARELSKNAFLKAVLHDGVNIHTVAHFGRHRPARLRTALELGAPPAFEGVTCVEPGCDRRYGLEWDHDNPVANKGPTSYENLKPLCWDHHRDKTERDRLAGLLKAWDERHGAGGEDPPGKGLPDVDVPP